MNFTPTKFQTFLLIFFIPLFLLIGCSKNNNNNNTTPVTSTLTITSLSVTTGPVNTSVTITGTGFNSNSGSDQVFFNGNQAIITLATTTKITVLVPLGAGTGNIKVTVGAKTVTGPVFTYQLSEYVSTFAGNGNVASVDGTGTKASFNLPICMAIDKSGNIYVGDGGTNMVRKVTPNAVVTTLCTVPQLKGIAIDATNNLYVLSNNEIEKITSAGITTTFAGSSINGFANGQGTAAQFSDPDGIVIDAAGNLYVSEGGNQIIRMISPSGLVTTYAGAFGGNPGNPINGTTSTATFFLPGNMVLDKVNNLYINDIGDQVIRKITPGGIVTTFAGNGDYGELNGLAANSSFTLLNGIAIDATGNIYITDQSSKIRMINTKGVVSDFAGTSASVYADGPLVSASFSGIGVIGIDLSGNIYAFDSGIIRKISMQ